MTKTQVANVAVIGLGQMGRGISRRLDAAGLLVGRLYLLYDEITDKLNDES